MKFPKYDIFIDIMKASWHTQENMMKTDQAVPSFQSKVREIWYAGRSVGRSICTSSFPLFRCYNLSVGFLFSNCQYHVSEPTPSFISNRYPTLIEEIHFRSKLQSEVLVLKCVRLLKWTVFRWMSSRLY